MKNRSRWGSGIVGGRLLEDTRLLGTRAGKVSTGMGWEVAGLGCSLISADDEAKASCRFQSCYSSYQEGGHARTGSLEHSFRPGVIT